MKISCNCDTCEFKHLENGLCEETRQEKFNEILNPWRDAEKEKPSDNITVLIEICEENEKEFVTAFFDIGKWWIRTSVYCIDGVEYPLKVLRWMHIPKNEGEE